MNGLYKRKIVPLTYSVLLKREGETKMERLGTCNEIKLERQFFFVLRANGDPGDWHANICTLAKSLSPWKRDYMEE